MAGVALIAIVAIVFIVFEMAGHAGRIHFVRKGTLRMAVATRQFCMAIKQLKFCVAGMIEARVIPVFRGMAVCTVVTAAAVMGVVFGVTANTGR